MTKKGEEAEEEFDMFNASTEELEKYIAEQLESFKKSEAERIKKELNKVKIEPIEDYLITLGYSSERPPKRVYKDFPDLFSSKTDGKKDTMSETAGIEASAATQLLCALMTAKNLNSKKKTKKK